MLLVFQDPSRDEKEKEKGGGNAKLFGLAAVNCLVCPLLREARKNYLCANTDYGAATI